MGPPKKNRMQKAVVSVKDQCCNDSPGIRFVTLRGPEDLSFSHGKCEQFSRRMMGGGALKYCETQVSTILRAVHFKLEYTSSRKEKFTGRNHFLQVSWGHNHIIKVYSTCSPFLAPLHGTFSAQTPCTGTTMNIVLLVQVAQLALLSATSSTGTPSTSSTAATAAATTTTNNNNNSSGRSDSGSEQSQ